MADGSSWMVRVGALLLLVSPFVPQGDVNGKRIGPFLTARDLVPSGAEVAGLGLAAWLFLPTAAGAALLAARCRRAAPGPVVRTLTLAVLLAASFALATVGSILLTRTGTGPAAPATPFALSLLLFLAPLLLGGVALARMAGGGLDRASGGFARFSIGVLLALHGFLLMAGGWELILRSIGDPGVLRSVAGAWCAPAGGLLAAAGEAFSRLRRVAVDSAPASG